MIGAVPQIWPREAAAGRARRHRLGVGAAVTLHQLELHLLLPRVGRLAVRAFAFASLAALQPVDAAVHLAHALVREARSLAEELLERDPDLEDYPELRERMPD